MKSFDVWDTLLGRWYCDPLTILDEVGQISGFENFTDHRKYAEFTSPDKSLSGIYHKLQDNLGLNDARRDRLMQLEITTEYDRSFRIEPICLRTVGIPFIVVSDFYFPLDNFKVLLQRNGLYPQNIYLSYDGKLTGQIWPTITEPIDLHIGNNYHSDIESARRSGINAEHIDFTRLNFLESWIYGESPNLACLSRLARLSSTVSGELQKVWDEASDVTLPLLILLAEYLHSFCNKHGYNKILFTERDCHYLNSIFQTMYPTFNAEPFYSSRDTYRNPSESFIKYVENVYTPTTLIVDMQGTGDTCYDFFNKYIQFPVNYFTVVDSDLDMKPYPNKYRIVYRRDGYTDRIERINYVNLGRVLDIYNPENGQYLPLRAYSPYSKEVDHLEQAINVGVRYLGKRFRYDRISDDIKLMLIVKLIRYMEESVLEISKYVNHEVF